MKDDYHFLRLPSERRMVLNSLSKRTFAFATLMNDSWFISGSSIFLSDQKCTLGAEFF